MTRPGGGSKAAIWLFVAGVACFLVAAAGYYALPDLPTLPVFGILGLVFTGIAVGLFTYKLNVNPLVGWLLYVAGVAAMVISLMFAMADSVRFALMFAGIWTMTVSAFLTRTPTLAFALTILGTGLIQIVLSFNGKGDGWFGFFLILWGFGWLIQYLNWSKRRKEIEVAAGPPDG